MLFVHCKIILLAKKLSLNSIFSLLYLEVVRKMSIFAVSKYKRLMKINELVRILRERGCSFLRSGKKHDIYLSPNGKKVSVPRHGSKEIPDGTLHSILKKAGLE